MNDAEKNRLKAMTEREQLRPHRANNHRIKRAAGFKCSECGSSEDLFVTQHGEVRCRRHLGRSHLAEGQRPRD